MPKPKPVNWEKVAKGLATCLQQAHWYINNYTLGAATETVIRITPWINEGVSDYEKAKEQARAATPSAAKDDNGKR